MQISEVKKTLEELLRKLNVDIKRIEVVAGDPHSFLNVSTSDSGILIGAQGENLRALNLILKRIVVQKEEKDNETASPTFLVDINSYHRKRILELKQRAQTLAERARTYKVDVAMDPINSYERLIVHSILSDDPDIVTESKGIGKTRHIVFKYKAKEEKTLSSDRELFTQKEAR